MGATRACFVVLLTVCMAGCFRVENLSRFQGCPAGSTSLDLEVTHVDMTSHVGQRLEVGLIDEEGNISARAVVHDMEATEDPATMMNTADQHFQIPCFLPSLSRQLAIGVHSVGSSDGSMDPPTDDALPAEGRSTTWSVTASQDGQATLDLTTPPVSPQALYPGVGGDLLFTGTGFAAPHGGELFVLRVIETDTSKVVGQYRLPSTPRTASFEARIAGILVAGRKYTVDFYEDANVNGHWDPPPPDNPGGDHQWEITFTATSGENALMPFPHNLMFQNIHFDG